MWLEVVETGGRLFDSPAPLKAVGAAFCPKSAGFMQSQHLFSQQATRAASPISPLVPNGRLVTSASPSCQKEPILWESLFPLRLMNLCPLLSLLKKGAFVK